MDRVQPPLSMALLIQISVDQQVHATCCSALCDSPRQEWHKAYAGTAMVLSFFRVLQTLPEGAHQFAILASPASVRQIV